MRRGEAVALAEPSTADSSVYEVVLLAGSPTRLVLRLQAGLERESTIVVDGTRWLVADVRRVEGETRPQLICIHPD